MMMMMMMMMMMDGAAADYTLKSCFLLKSLNLISFKFCLESHKAQVNIVVFPDLILIF